MTHVEYTKCDSCSKTKGDELHWFHIRISYDSQESDFDFCSKACFLDFVQIMNGKKEGRLDTARWRGLIV